MNECVKEMEKRGNACGVKKGDPCDGRLLGHSIRAERVHM